jgi:denticleless
MNLLAPNASLRVILEDRLNLALSTSKNRSPLSASRPKEFAAPRKRTAKRHSQENKQKRPKLCEVVSENSEDETEEEDPALFEDSDEDEPVVSCPRARQRTAFHAYSAFASISAHTNRGLNGTIFLFIIHRY